MSNAGTEVKQLPQDTEDYLRHLLKSYTSLRAAVDHGVTYAHHTSSFTRRTD